MKYILILMLIILLVGCSMVPDQEPFPTCRVLLIGAGDYDGCGADLTAPPYAVDSMEELFNRCYIIEVLTILKDKDATRRNILNEIWYTFQDAKENDVSIFYWAGHGGSKDNTFQILPVDYLTNGRISVAELEYSLDKIAGTKIVILDTCHSGGFIGKSIAKLLNKQGYQVWTSCMGEQVCYQVGATEWSDPYMVFTRGILEGCKNEEYRYLADINRDRIVTMTEAYNFAINWVADNLSKEQDAQIYPEGSTFPLLVY